MIEHVPAFARHFGDAVVRHGRGDDPALIRFGAALACMAVDGGHVCVDLGEIGSLFDGLPEDTEFPSVEALLDALRSSRAVRTRSSEAVTPLVLAGNRLYLDRYWGYEQALIERLAAQRFPARDLELGQVRAVLDSLYPTNAENADKTAPQRAAVERVLLNRLAIITGGPGTGKTTTVSKLLEAIDQLLPDKRVMLVAPTGKAANRLSEVASSANVRASTIHSALGVINLRTPRYRHHAGNPLPADILVADEVSMIDVAQLSRLVQAMPQGSRIVLMGDPDQLASIDAGAVLGDLREAALLQPVHVRLSHNFRYETKPGIGALADAIQRGDDEAVVEVLEKHDEVNRVDAMSPALLQRLEDGFAEAAAAETPADALQALGRMRVLCAHRVDVRQLNETLEERLRKTKKIRVDQDWYVGRPVLVRRNDKARGLSNGDVGIIRAGSTPDERVAWFDGGRSFGAGTLPEHETVFATTIHKSQGSEYDEVVVVLPKKATALCTRELLYTAVTRAKGRVTIVGPVEVVKAAVRNRTERMSGIADGLSGKSPEDVEIPF